MTAILEMELDQVADFLTKITHWTITKTPENVNDLDSETTLILLEGIINQLNPQIEQVCEAIKQERDTSKEWKQYIAKLPSSERLDATKEFANKIEALELSSLVPTVKQIQIHMIQAREDAKTFKKNIELKLRATYGTTAPVFDQVITPQNPYGIEPPSIEIPIFNGGLNGTNFVTFWQLFKILIDENDIPDVVKYGILHSKLEDIPKQIIKGDNKLHLTSENYVKAKKILKDTYGKTEDNLRRIRSDLFNIPACRQNSEIHTMFHLADSLISQIEALTKEVNNSPEILQLLESRLTEYYGRRLIIEKRSIVNWNLTEFRRIMPILISEDNQLTQILGSRYEFDEQIDNYSIALNSLWVIGWLV
jgi:hypothetical protein